MPIVGLSGLAVWGFGVEARMWGGPGVLTAWSCGVDKNTQLICRFIHMPAVRKALALTHLCRGSESKRLKPLPSQIYIYSRSRSPNLLRPKLASRLYDCGLGV